MGKKKVAIASPAATLSSVSAPDASTTGTPVPTPEPAVTSAPSQIPAAFVEYRKKNVHPMRPYVPGEDMAGISVSAEDTPEEGGMVAMNPKNLADQWYIAKQFFLDNYVPASIEPSAPTAAPAPQVQESSDRIPPYQQRLLDERDQLDDRLTKLKAFFSTETFANLTNEKQHVLQSQSNHMANYLQILNYRISEF